MHTAHMEFCTLNAHKTLHRQVLFILGDCQQLTSAHMHIQTLGKTNMHLFPKAHDVRLCWSNAV